MHSLNLFAQTFCYLYWHSNMTQKRCRQVTLNTQIFPPLSATNTQTRHVICMLHRRGSSKVTRVTDKYFSPFLSDRKKIHLNSSQRFTVPHAADEQHVYTYTVVRCHKYQPVDSGCLTRSMLGNKCRVEGDIGDNNWGQKK